jgi:hypothetical protein
MVLANPKPSRYEHIDLTVFPNWQKLLNLLQSYSANWPNKNFSQSEAVLKRHATLLKRLAFPTIRGIFNKYHIYLFYYAPVTVAGYTVEPGEINMGETVTPKIEEEEENDVTIIGSASFTPEQVNAIVRERLARSKARSTRALNGLEARVTQLQAELDRVKPVADRYSATVADEVKTMRAGLSPGIQTLLDKLTPLEQKEWIEANGDATTSARAIVPAGPMPKTPKAITSVLDKQSVLDQKLKSNLEYGL